MSLQIERKQAQLPTPVPLPDTLESALVGLRKAQHTVRDLSRKAYKLKDQHRQAKAQH